MSQWIYRHACNIGKFSVKISEIEKGGKLWVSGTRLGACIEDIEMKGFLCCKWVSQTRLKMPRCIMDNYGFPGMNWGPVSAH